MDAKRMGCFIARIRKEKKMTQAELAEKLHVTDKAVSRWERGVGFPDIVMLEPLAGELGISVLELINGQREEALQVDRQEVCETLGRTLQLALLEGRKKVLYTVCISLITSIGAGLVMCGILWRMSLLQMMELLEKADGPQAVFVAWRTDTPFLLILPGGMLIAAGVLLAWLGRRQKGGTGWRKKRQKK